MKQIRIVFSFVIAMCLTLILAGCSSAPEEKMEMSTNLSLSPTFEGTRVFSLTLPSSYSPGSQNAEALENIVAKYCPKPLTYSSATVDGKLKYTFILSFSSLTDYNSKLTDVIGSRPTVVFSNPNTPLTTGWQISEYFQSAQLLSWLTDAISTEEIPDLDLFSAENTTSVTFDGQTVSTLPTISINKLKGYPISKVNINTVNSRSTYDRTVSFVIPQSTFDSLGDSLSKYFASVTDASASSDWLLEDNSYIYTVSFSTVTLKELEGYTNRLFSSVYGDVSYLGKDKASTPLAYQNTFTETIDLSCYISENSQPVPLEYTYSLADGADLNLPEIYSDLEWSNADPNADTATLTKTATIKSSQPSLTLRITDGKQYVPKNIALTLTPVDNDNLRKTISFSFDIAKDGYEASNYTNSFFQSHGVTSSLNVDGGDSVCTVTFSGTVSEINQQFSSVFGMNNNISMTTGKPFFTLRTAKQITDKLDLSQLLSGKNYDTPVTYTLLTRDGESADSLSMTISDTPDPVNAEKTDAPGLTVSITTPVVTITAGSSGANWSEIITFILISSVLVLITIALIILMRRKSTASLVKGSSPAQSLPEEKEPSKSLPTDKKDAQKKMTDKKTVKALPAEKKSAPEITPPKKESEKNDD